MIKIGLEIKEVENTLNIRMLEATKKQLESATENEKITAQLIKDLLDNRLLELLEEENKKENEKEN